MTRLVARACSWLLVAAVPFHALTALDLDWRGPAHVHVVGHEHAHEHASRYGHYAHVHGHLSAERHHHAADDTSVVRLDSHAGETVTMPSGRSARMIAVLVSAVPDFVPPKAAGVRHAAPAASTIVHFPSALERPPRASPA